MAGTGFEAAFSGTKTIAEPLRIDTGRLGAWLATRLPQFSGPLAVRQFKGGQSNPTYLLETPQCRYVLRRKPPGKLLPSAHAVDREFRVMTALHAQGFPVPKPFVYCDDPTVVGTAFFLMSYVEGRIFWDPLLPRSNARERAAIYDAVNATIARLHCFDAPTIGLAGYGRGENYVARQVNRWSEQYRSSETETIDDMERLIAALPHHLPPAGVVRLVHGDFRLDNVIIATDRPEVIAVIDWELSTLGDPLADYSYHLMKWYMPTAPGSAMAQDTGSLTGADLDALGIPPVEHYVDAYAKRTGLDPRPHLAIYLAYNFFRLAAIYQGIAGRLRDGTATSEHAAGKARMVRPLAAAAWSFAEAAGAG